jgi:hypothetical protein
MNDRIETFIDWFGTSVRINDCDPALFMTSYFFDRFEFNLEQKYWLCWIYGTTYHWPTTYVIWNEFPDFNLVGQKRLENWNSENYKRLRYQTDTKWNKGHLPTMFKSYRENVLKSGNSQHQYFQNLRSNPNDWNANFWNIYNTINKDFFKFGRYSTWFYLQILKQCVGVQVEPDSLLLSDGGSESHRNGFLYAIGKEDLIDTKIPKDQFDEFEKIAKEILGETRKRFPDVDHKIDFFAMETCLCSFKKLFRIRDGRYLGYYLDRQSEEIKKVEQDGWIGINWTPLWQCREEIVDRKWLTNAIDPAKMQLFLKTGDIHSELETNSLDDFFS